MSRFLLASLFVLLLGLLAGCGAADDVVVRGPAILRGASAYFDELGLAARTVASTADNAAPFADDAVARLRQFATAYGDDAVRAASEAASPPPAAESPLDELFVEVLCYLGENGPPASDDPQLEAIFDQSQ